MRMALVPMFAHCDNLSKMKIKWLLQANDDNEHLGGDENSHQRKEIIETADFIIIFEPICFRIL